MSLYFSFRVPVQIPKSQYAIRVIYSHFYRGEILLFYYFWAGKRRWVGRPAGWGWGWWGILQTELKLRILLFLVYIQS